jgi:NH3-dependent NAD+ synthetase
MNKNTRECFDAILHWIALQAERFDAKGAVVKVGGDLCSAVTLAVTREVFGNETFALILPCHDRSSWIQDAQWTANHFEVPFELVDLSPVFDSLALLLPSHGDGRSLFLKTSLQNLAHRHYADAKELLMVGSEDLVEYELAGIPGHPNPLADLIPLGHLLRRDLRRLGRHLGLPRRMLDRSKPLDAEALSRSGLESQPSSSELDGYLSGDFSGIPTRIRLALQAMNERALQLRQLPLHNRAAGPSAEADLSLSDEHDALDRSIEALSLISKAITSDQYLEDILRLIVMVTAEVMKSSVCSLWLLDEKESVLRLRATQSIDSEYLKDRVLKVGEGIVGKVVAQNRACVVTNVLTDPIFKEKDLARRMGLVSMLSVPMRVGERVIGVINCYTSHPHAFSDLQMNLLTTVANQAAVAIEKTELMVKTKVISEELERRKIIERAKDLLMKRLSLSGEEAYRWLQKRSMNTRKSMREVSEAVLLAMEG